jgi:hypothetical protein
VVRGTLHVALADGSDRDQQISRRLTAFGLYLTAWVEDKFRGEDLNGDGQITGNEVFFENDKYGNFKAWSTSELEAQAAGVKRDAKPRFPSLANSLDVETDADGDGDQPDAGGDQPARDGAVVRRA